MKRMLVVMLLFLIFLPAYSQKKRERVKRKYRQVESVNRNLARVFLWGKVMNPKGELLQGVSVVWIGSVRGVHTNTEGEYLLTGLPTGRQRIRASLAGYKTKYTDIVIQEGINELYFTLDEEPVRTGPFITTLQKREQQTLDVPSSPVIFSQDQLTRLDADQVHELAGFSPGTAIRLASSLHPVYTFRGLSSDHTGISPFPGIVTFYNEVPLSRAAGSSLRLFDVERIEIHKGPQNTLSGNEALIGAIHYISRKPSDSGYGSVSVRYGNLGRKSMEGMVNVPILEKTLLARAAGFYDHREGYIANAPGGSLNGIHKAGGRVSLRYLPGIFWRFNLEVNYQKDNEPGVSYLHPFLPDTFGDTGLFTGRTSLNGGDTLSNTKELFHTILKGRYYITEHTYFSSTSSFQIHSAGESWDGDGTAADALYCSTEIGVKRFTQELRLNVTRNSRLNGFGNVRYVRENASLQNALSTNEQHLYSLIFDPGNLVDNLGQPNAVRSIPPGSTAAIPEGTPLSGNHREERTLEGVNQWIEISGQATWNLAYRLRLTGGLQMAYTMQELSNTQSIADGSESVLGQITGATPNLYYTPADKTTGKTDSLTIVYRAGLTYKFSPDATIYGNYASGLKPGYMYFQNNGEAEKIPAGHIQNFELGFKGIYQSRLWFDATAFYSRISGISLTLWNTDPGGITGASDSRYSGKATIYGIEAQLHYAILRGVDFFGNYAWIKTRIDDQSNEGDVRDLQGNRLRLSPEHSFGAGMYLSTPVAPGIQLFASPTYTYQSDLFFDDANTKEMYQKAYGIWNAQAGVHITQPGVTFQIYARNILNEQYALYTGIPGPSFGPVLAVPSPPRMVGARLTWNFSLKEKPYYKRRRR